MCPLNSTGGEMCSGGTPGSKPLCVSATQCQKICKVDCPGVELQQGRPACYNEGRSCCNQECIGGCTANNSSHCTACRHFDYYGICVEKCPGHLFNYLDRRCVSNDECQAQPPPLTPYETPPKHWKFVRNELTLINVCVLDCPKDYEEKEVALNRFECHRCVGPCERTCEGGNIESIQKLQSYRDCTHIKGSLEIQIQNGANVVKELEDNLGMVEEIEGYLKIARSYPVMSLNFFKKLRVIRGRDLETNKFALVVLDNQNLMELWDWDKRDKNLSLTIEQGRMFFHFNPKLCYDHIEKLANVTNFTEGPTDTEAPKSSNGDKAACNITPIKATATAHRWGTIISWERFNHYDPRALLSYLIFYKETKDQNVTIYDGRDACGGDGWKMEDVENKDANVALPTNMTAAEPSSPDLYNSAGNQVDSHVTQILTSLKPFTQYAYYVRTYTIATERSGAQSPIQYFITLPSTPSVPRELSARPLSSSDLEISWKPPQTPNGNVTHYYIVGVWERDDPAILAQRNYCNKQTTPSPVLPGESTTVQPSQTKTTITPSNKPANDSSPGGKPRVPGLDDEECECNKKNTNNEDAKQKENNRQIEIDFENALQNVVYVKSNVSFDESKYPLDLSLDAFNRYHWTPVVESGYPVDEGFNRRRREVGGGAEPVFPSHNVVGGAENVFPSHNVTVGESNKTNQYIIIPSPEGNKTTSDGVFERFEFVVYGATSFIVRNLSHYAKYNIDVQACRETVPNESFDSANSNCSTKSMVTRRTMSKDGVDTIDSTKFKVEFVNNSWFAEWEAPPAPNGLILAYKVDIVRQDKAKYVSTHEPCISKLDYDREKRYEIPLDVLPSPGNYSIRVRVISLAGDGPWSDKLYFVVQKETLSTMEWIFICLLVLLVLVVISLLIIYYRREHRRPPAINPSVNPEYIPERSIHITWSSYSGSFPKAIRHWSSWN
uniref:receptor protein-tyrosine kinase n=1 Tax=Cacopsylla melanoneura TaxID=428564 RepID=A0A8D9BPN7_9HEMI